MISGMVVGCLALMVQAGWTLDTGQGDRGLSWLNSKSSLISEIEKYVEYE